MKTSTALLFLLLGAYSPVTSVPSVAAFTPTRSMNTPRVNHTATLLQNGKVLIAGGSQRVLPEAMLTSAELYDPSIGAFTATGSMTRARSRHSATLLPDGRVLIVGGSNESSAEIYDADTGSFNATATPVAIPYPSFRPSTALLNDGRVLTPSQPTAQLYDPVTRRFVSARPYVGPAPTWIQSATLLADGRVLIIGDDAQLYDAVREVFAHGGYMNYSYDVLTATLLMDGRVLALGNNENPERPADAEVFDPVENSFTLVAKARENHEYAAATLLGDGQVLVTGGQRPGGQGHAVSELFDPASNTFSAAGNMIVPRHQHTTTLLNDGTVLIAGGFSGYPVATSSAELYHPSVLLAAPLLFSLSGGETGRGAIWHSATGQVVSPASRAVAGECLSMYTANLAEGGAIPPQVAIGGRLAEILFLALPRGAPVSIRSTFACLRALRPVRQFRCG